MLKLLPTEPPKFHNFKCGEIYCLNPTSYNVTCCLCGKKVAFEQFPQHFQAEHLSETPTQTPFPMPVQLPLDHKEETIESVDTAFVQISEDPIKSELENSDGGDSDAGDHGFDAPFSNSIDDVLEDEQPIDFDDLNLLQTTMDDNPEKPEAIENNSAEIKRGRPKREAVKKSEKSSHPDWYNDDSSSDGRDNEDDVSKADKTGDIDSQPYPCPDCMRSYKSKRSMMAHHRQSHNPNKRPTKPPNMKHICEECGEVFRSARNLRGHRYKHTGIMCDVCGKSFTQTGNLARHKVRHSGIKAFKCQECGNDFFTNKELNAHMLRHTGERPVVCEICGKRCRDHGVYKAHMRRHTGERPAKCDVCGKAFYSFHDLNVHAVTHSTARPFACDMCGSTFQRKKSLRVHKKLHSKDRNHECKVCGKTFAQTGGLNAHMRTHDAALSKTIGITTNNTATTIAEDLMSLGTANELTAAGIALDIAKIEH